MRFLLRLVISALVIFGVAYLSRGGLLQVDDFVAAFWAALVLGLVNAVVRPVVSFFSLPLTILTLGLFYLVINAFMLWIVAAIVPGVDTVGFWRTILAALIIAVGTSVLTGPIDRGD